MNILFGNPIHLFHVRVLASLTATCAMAFISACTLGDVDVTVSDEVELSPPPLEEAVIGERTVATGAAERNNTELRLFKVATNNYMVPDPHYVDQWSEVLTAEVYSGLMRFKDVESRTEVELDQASRFTLSDDDKAYLFYLRRGLFFSDGTPVRASDFKWSWERALRIDFDGRAWNAFGQIEGAREFANGNAQDVSGITVIDEGVLGITLTMPSHDLLMRLAGPLAVVLKPSNVAAWGADFSVLADAEQPPKSFDFHDLPVGTGPFRFVELDFLGRAITLERNTSYAHDLTWLDRVEFTTYPVQSFAETDLPTELSIKWTSLKAGETDVFESLVDPRQYDPDGYQSRWRVTEQQSGFTSRFLLLNDAVPPFNDSAFRRALAATYDAAPFVTLAGNLVPTGIAPSTLSAVQPDIPLNDRQLPPASQEPLGWGSSVAPQLELAYDRSDGVEPVYLEVVFGQWGALLDVDVGYVGLGSWEFSNHLRSGKWGMLAVESSTFIPSPSVLYDDVIEAISYLTESRHWAKIRELILESQFAIDQEQVRALRHEIEDLVAEHALVVPVEWDVGSRFVVVPTHYAGYDIPMFYGSRFSDLEFND